MKKPFSRLKSAEQQLCSPFRGPTEKCKQYKFKGNKAKIDAERANTIPDRSSLRLSLIVPSTKDIRSVQQPVQWKYKSILGRMLYIL